MPKRVSVIVPVYNVERILPRCLESLRLQTLQDLEVVLVDDASTDGSASVAAAYVERYPEIFRLLCQPLNQGPAAARNAGLAVATGEFVGFVDSDDTVHGDMFRHMYETAFKNSLDVVFCGVRVEKEGYCEEIIPHAIHTPADALADARILALVSNKLYRRSFLQERGIVFPESALCSEDVAFSFKVMASNPALGALNTAFYNYCISDASISFDLHRRIFSLEALRDIRNFLQQHQSFTTYKSYYRNLVWHHALYYPACLLCIDSLLKGHRRWQNIKSAPEYFFKLCTFLLGR